MNKARAFVLLSISSLLFFFGVAPYAEPWLANRYAQNCAACHAPGRPNRPPEGRRCTLSCQGCHVSPQGGGMRNQYGVWTQQRWLRSGTTDVLKDKYNPAPLDKQPYHGRLKEITQKYSGRKPQQVSESKASPRPTRRLGAVPGMTVTRNVDPHIRLYDKFSYDEWHIIVPDNAEFESIIPKDDPYRLERTESIYAGGSLRYLYGSIDRQVSSPASTVKGKVDLNFLMAADIGARFRPFKTHKASFVLESRFKNSAVDSELDQGFTSGAQVKSAYLLVDDLMYNSFIQTGLYRPLFGLYTPDHTTLSQDIAGLDQKSVFRAIGFGAAPNIPFFTFSYLMPTSNDAQPVQSTAVALGNSDKGFVATVGGRWITYSANIALSYWSTQATAANGDVLNRNLMALTAGGMYQNLIVNLEMLRADKEFQPGAKDIGTVYTVESRYKLWRENYAVLNYAMGNTNRFLKEGSANEMMLGFKSFPLSGMEFEGLYVMRDSKTKSSDQTTKDVGFQLQANIFF